MKTPVKNRMRTGTAGVFGVRGGIATLALATILMGANLAQAADEFMKASLADPMGNVVLLSKIDAATTVNGQYKGQDIRIPVRNLKRVENLGNRQLRVTNLAGEQFILETSWVENRPGEVIKYWIYSEIDGEEKETTMDYYDFAERFHTLAFHSDIGRLKFNSKTKRYYPPDYIFDPFTGDELQWNTPER